MGDYTLKDCSVRHTVADETGPLVELNLTYPRMSGLRDKYLEKRFNDYYDAISDGLRHFAEKKLAAPAAGSREKNGHDFKKWALVSKYRCIKENAAVGIQLKVWIYRDGERREKLLKDSWPLTAQTPFLHRAVNKRLLGGAQD